ncbi:hypothetical protein HK099_003877 [Clydaea vesicula]|uniref:C2H2-type domain-containing protein n=1 Tax=Clydaea vesicula TaxID=447962 RepID=A0AAD5U1G4_9FUNG|nr:hypothetical protein HK099_003877 [Clydaea vesicula]
MEELTICKWENCKETFDTETACFSHITQVHAKEGRQICKWIRLEGRPGCGCSSRHRGNSHLRRKHEHEHTSDTNIPSASVPQHSQQQQQQPQIQQKKKLKKVQSSPKVLHSKKSATELETSRSQSVSESDRPVPSLDDSLQFDLIPNSKLPQHQLQPSSGENFVYRSVFFNQVNRLKKTKSDSSLQSNTSAGSSVSASSSTNTMEEKQKKLFFFDSKKNFNIIPEITKKYTYKSVFVKKNQQQQQQQQIEQQKKVNETNVANSLADFNRAYSGNFSSTSTIFNNDFNRKLNFESNSNVGLNKNGSFSMDKSFEQDDDYDSPDIQSFFVEKNK